MAILHQSATSVDVTFRGSQDDIRLIDPNQIKAVVDLKAVEAGTEEALVGPKSIEGVRGVRAVEVRPDRVWVTLDRESEKNVVVKGMYSGKPLLGQVESVVCDPPVVRLRGPARKLATAEFLYTAPVDVDGRIEPFAKRAPVLPPSDTWVARMEPSEVQVRINIVQKSGERQWDSLPVVTVVPPGVPVRTTVKPGRVRVIVSGRSDLLEGMADGHIKVLADCTGLAVPGEHDVRLLAHLPTESGLTARTDPEMVHVVLERP
jgi:YbbR domain-containing protein